MTKNLIARINGVLTDTLFKKPSYKESPKKTQEWYNIQEVKNATGNNLDVGLYRLLQDKTPQEVESYIDNLEQHSHAFSVLSPKYMSKHTTALYLLNQKEENQNIIRL